MAPRVGLFVTCLVDLMRPSVGFAAVKLLEQSMPAVKNVQKQILAPVPPELRETFQRCLRLIAGIEEE